MPTRRVLIGHEPIQNSIILPARAYHLGHHAYALVGDPEAKTLTLRALGAPRRDRRQG
ncbi:MAG: hypothetical protein ACR2GU_02560 [Rubrobacteraceae bacterium]